MMLSRPNGTQFLCL